MNSVINYMIEANLSLVFGLLFYKLILEKETRFAFQRLFLLVVIIASLLLPLIHWQSSAQQVIPSVSQLVPMYWLPEFSVKGNVEANDLNSYNTNWTYVRYVYLTGAGVSLALFLFQFLNLILLLRKSKRYTYGSYNFIECNFNSTFSFFHYIFIRTSDIQSESEKQQVIRHELVHVRQWHSIDILLISFLKILFWFNPCIYLYRKAFVHLHEFEADARAVENQDVNRYCSLLARIALQSAGLPLANHFNNSITLKRIQMMRTFKTNIKRWKIGVCLLILPILFIAIACQDQIMNEVADSTLSQVSEYPAHVKADAERFAKDFPEAKFTYIEGTEKEITELIKSQYASHMIVGTYLFGEKTGILMKDLPTMQMDNGVFMVVEQMPEFPNGMEGLGSFLHSNIKYPEDSRKANISGTVYVQFVVSETGVVTDAIPVKGVDKLLDAEAVRVVAMMPAWKAGQQNGKAVKTRMVLPIKFASDFKSEALRIESDPYQMQPSIQKEIIDGKSVLKGKITGQDGKGLPGINVVVVGTTQGTVTDMNGAFRIVVPEQKGEITCSFIGYETKKLSF